MPSTANLKGRIRSVKNTGQITRAMQLVAASKMRRAQDSTRASAPYTQAARELLTYFRSMGTTKLHPLFEHREVKSRLLIVITSDKGLAGAYNTNVLKLYTAELQKDDRSSISNETIAVGRKATQFVTRLKDTSVVGAYENIPDHPGGSELHAILDTALAKFKAKDVDAVDVVYTEFVSSLRQEARLIRVLPAGFDDTVVRDVVSEAEYEPGVDEVLDEIAPRLVGAQIFQALLEARASEHSMRMLAMKNATDNADDLVTDLTLEMNKARQGAITQELAEISGGAEAMTE